MLVPVTLLLVAAAIAGTLYFRSRQATTRLTDKDTIVLSDFINKTGDSVFDDTLKQGLSVQLRAIALSRFGFGAQGESDVEADGAFGGGPLDAGGHAGGLQAHREQGYAYGLDCAVGRQYVIGLKTVNRNTRDVPAEAQERAAGKQAVLKALDAAAVSMRSKLGECRSARSRNTPRP